MNLSPGWLLGGLEPGWDLYEIFLGDGRCFAQKPKWPLAAVAGLCCKLHFCSALGTNAIGCSYFLESQGAKGFHVLEKARV
jgi:hypothetical protein